MRVLQLIDSLNAGGAERVAVNYANALVSYVDSSFLCTTREEGLLKKGLNQEVNYIFLKKKASIDISAITLLNGFVRSNNIDLIHAHASSFFLATIIKILNPKLKLIWHEHYGNRKNDSNFNYLILKFCSCFFSDVITVSKSLRELSENQLFIKKAHFLPNYPVEDYEQKLTTLKGQLGKRIICLANFRPDKDHLNLLKAFNLVIKSRPDWTLHLIGKYQSDNYFKEITRFLNENSLLDSVFIYGSCPDTFNVLKQSSIGVLASKSEGLPMVLLEYAIAGLPVVVTNVGDCKEVISTEEEGLIVEAQNENQLANALLSLINDESLREKTAIAIEKKVRLKYSKKKVIESLYEIYKTNVT